ncbi:MAG: class I SAM-dependent methyltransferase [Actinomycetota bacterium]|nr:class I SAM-dependent methyltransferase [Actinomycetota bacterium]
MSSQVRIPPGRDDAPWSGGTDVLNLAGIVVLLKHPLTVVETGVATGYTTSVILSALRDNDAGVLHSIDLPPLQVAARSFVGRAVSAELRDRWSLHLGPSRWILPRLAASVGPIDLFVHDGDHSYAGQYDDFRRLWPHLAMGGTLICDDVCNSAFPEFAAEVGERAFLIAPPEHLAAVGLMVKTHSQ